MLTVDYAAITEQLWVGSYPQSPEDVLHLKSEGVDAILNLQSDDDLNGRAINWDLFWKFYVSQGFQVKRVKIQDFEPDDLEAHLPEGVAALDELLSAGRRVYLHCTAGLNRSPTVAIAWLVTHRGMTLKEALEFFTERRTIYPYLSVLERWARR